MSKYPIGYVHKQLSIATNLRSGQRRSLRSKLDPTGKQQDCLGMTPLHILACSTVDELSLYQVLIEKYPEGLITEDRFGALPLLYLLWGRKLEWTRDAPGVPGELADEIVELLVESYKSIYPKYELNWTRMIEILCESEAESDSVVALNDIQLSFFPDAFVDWDTILEARSLDAIEHPWRTLKMFLVLVCNSIQERKQAIGIKRLRDDLPWGRLSLTMLQDNVDIRRSLLADVRTRLANYEREYSTEGIDYVD